MPRPQHAVAPSLLLECDLLDHIVPRWAFHPAPVTATVRGYCVEVTVTLRPIGLPIIGTLPPGPQPLTECEQDIIDVLSCSDRPLTRPKIIDQLRKLDKHHGESTIARSLPSLVARGLIVRVGTRHGYTIPDSADDDTQVEPN